MRGRSMTPHEGLGGSVSWCTATSPGPGGAPTPAQQAGEDEADEGAWDGEDEDGEADEGRDGEDGAAADFVRNPSLRAPRL